MKILLPGGSGQLGRLLTRAFAERGDDVVVLTRSGETGGRHPAARYVGWDARTLGPWQREIDGADVVINLAGRSVDCRYDKGNLEAMLSSRIDSTRTVGQAIAAAQHPPTVWLQMSTATIYAHRFDAANDEVDGQIGGFEPDAPAYWRTSVHIAEAWERTLMHAAVPATRRVALRTAMVMSNEPGGPLATLRRLTRIGMGGTIAGGAQYMSWIHQDDFVRALLFLIEHDDLAGPVNLASPHPLPQRAFGAALRAACRVPFGLPATRWMVELGAIGLRTDAELVLKSRRVVPRRLLEAGFRFRHETWREAARDLAARA